MDLAKKSHAMGMCMSFLSSPGDRLMCDLEERFPVDDDLRLHSGMYPWKFASDELGKMPPQEYWLKLRNHAVAQRLDHWRNQRLTVKARMHKMD
jgi:hypothetical protein